MKILMQKILKSLSRAIIKKYRPRVVGITGSVGKTSVKMAAEAVLSGGFEVRASQKSYNNEFGLPLTIIGKTPGRFKIGWLFLIFKAMSMLIVKDKKYPEVLVLEMGADHPGDLDYLLNIATPDIGVMTGIGAAHTEFFKTVKGVLKEKQKVVMNLSKTGIAVLNADDEMVMSISDKIKNQIITYGLNPSANVQVTEMKVLCGFKENDGYPNGMRFKVSYNGSLVPMEIKGSLGECAVSSIVGGVAIGVAAGLNLVDIAKGLENFEGPPGRMRILSGIKHSLLIDDSYNSSPKAAMEALKSFGYVSVKKPAEKWVVLGDMRELGGLSEDAHREIGHAVALFGVDHLVTVGELGKDISKAAIEAGMNEEYIYEFADSPSAGKFIQEKLIKDSAILIKGSQAVRMEKITKELMADPLSADRLLVRQGDQWKD
jgi:UDP-N-acetylmuramoyl-tripeptide--D-alanyl-D-alanine ligase